MPKDNKPEKDPTGARPEWKAIQARKQMMGMIKLFVVVVILGAVVGVGVANKDRIAKLFEKAPELSKPAPKAEPEKPVLPPAPPPKVEKPVMPPPKQDAAPAALPPKVAAVEGGQEAQAQELISKGRESMDKLDFAGAKKLFSQAVALKSGAVKEDAIAWEKKAEAFRIATDHIKVSEFADAETSHVIETVDGRVFANTLIVTQNDEKVVFRSYKNPVSTGRITTEIPKNELVQATPVTKTQRRNDFLQLLGHLENGVSVERSTDYYDLVVLSKRLGLGKECNAYLTRAYSGSAHARADADLGNSFRKEVIRRYIDSASLMLASGRPRHLVEAKLKELLTTLPNYEVAVDEVESFRLQVMSKIKEDFKSTLTLKAAEAKPVAAVDKKSGSPEPKATAKQLVAEKEEDSAEVMIENSGVTASGKAASVVGQANGKYEEGMKLYRGFKQGTNGNNNAALKAALEKLVEAVDLYDKVLQLEPSNKAVMDRQTEANMIVYACKKYQTL